MTKIKIKGKTYPAYPTIGAMVRYKDLTGIELDSTTQPTDMMKYMYCCIISACRREDVDFPYTDLYDFVDNLLPSEFQRWAESINAESGKEDEAGDKKK